VSDAQSLRPLPQRMTPRQLVDASPEQRAAWLAEADETAPARAARMRETLAGLANAADLTAAVVASHKAPAAAPLPVGVDREAATRAYAAWQDAQVAASRESCDHGESLARTCLTCYDGRVWEAAGRPCRIETAAAEAAEAGGDVMAAITAEAETIVREAAVEAHEDDAPPTMEEAITDISLSLQDAGYPDDEEADEEAERLARIVKAAVMASASAPEPDRWADIRARLTALEQRPPVIAPPAIPAELRAQIERAEGVADTARKAVEALTRRFEALAQPAHDAEVRERWAAEDRADEARAVPRPMTLRSSALPLFAACAASMDLSPEQIRIESSGEPARLGTAVHAAAAIMVRRGAEAARDACDEIAERHQVDRDDLGRLVWLASEAWAKVRDRFPAPVVESSIREARQGVVLTGHPDIYSLSGRALRILDWKSGRVVYDTREQLLGYALLVLSIITDEETAGLDTIEVCTAWLRDGRMTRIRFTVEEVIAWGRQLEDRAKLRPLPYSPGEHCLGCPRRADCPAKVAWVRQAVAEMGVGTPTEALAKARAVAKAAEQAIEAIRGQAIAAGVEGLEVREEQRVTVRLAHAAVPQAVREVLGAEATASGGDVRAALRKVLGLTGEGIEEEMARLVEAGAVKVITSRKVKEQKS